VERDKPIKIGIGWTNFAAASMETKKGGFKKILIPTNDEYQFATS
jgi:hypothetical protein